MPNTTEDLKPGTSVKLPDSDLIMCVVGQFSSDNTKILCLFLNQDTKQYCMEIFHVPDLEVVAEANEEALKSRVPVLTTDFTAVVNFDTREQREHFILMFEDLHILDDPEYERKLH